MEVAMFVLLLLSCAPSVELLELLEPEPRAALEAAVVACVEDPDCMASLDRDGDLLENCPWYEAVGCSAVVVAAGAACVVTDGEACLEALEAVAAIGCCDCLPSGKVQDLCREI